MIGACGLRFALGAALLFVLLQFVRPKLPNPPAEADLQVPIDVKHILRTSCYSCHSNETRLSWFDQIVPAYQLVVHDVKTGRRRLNFSELGAEPVARQNAILLESVNQIQMGAMPLRRYTRLHPEAVVTSAQLAVLRDYLLRAQSTLQSGSEAADAQYRQWITEADKPRAVQNAPNGIGFLPDYKNWQVVSSTDRVDTNTLRLILGNEVAIRAMAANHINPWPNGTTFAKVAWRQQLDENGVSRTGEFFQVAFMIKDSEKYASSAGWGWAQWSGTELKPYGADATFSAECVACHAPLRQNDYVFTMPITALRGVR